MRITKSEVLFVKTAKQHQNDPNTNSNFPNIFTPHLNLLKRLPVNSREKQNADLYLLWLQMHLTLHESIYFIAEMIKKS